MSETTTALFGLDPWVLVALLATFFAGGLVKGGIGFGMPLVSLSLAPLFIEIEQALVANAMVLPFTNALQIRQAGALGETLRRFWPLALTLALVMPFGVWLGTLISPEGLSLSLGIAIMTFTVIQGTNPRLALPVAREKPIGAVVGVFAGITGGLVTINGPFFILYLVGIGAERRLMLSSLGVFFMVTGLILAVAFVSVGVMTAERAAAGIACLPPSLLGMWLGNRLGRRIPQQTFRAIVLAGLFIAGANIALRGLMA
ncbi:MAG: sulfite exporter TauE/SafE family protein [Pseudomonadota bacterium]